jgi:hypothetical protein
MTFDAFAALAEKQQKSPGGDSHARQPNAQRLVRPPATGDLVTSARTAVTIPD